MKVKKPAFIAVIIVSISGIGVPGFLQLRSRLMIPRQSLQDKIQEPESNPSVSFSMSKVLFLLAIGISGALSVRRTKKDKRKSPPSKKPQKMSSDRNKACVRLNKQYLNLQYKITQTKFSGAEPTDVMRKKIADLERQVRMISRAME